MDKREHDIGQEVIDGVAALNAATHELKEAARHVERRELAAKAMQGLLAGGNMSLEPKLTADLAVQHADALLAKLQES